MNPEKIRIAFLDVGQADSTVVTLPDESSAVVIDCPPREVTIDYLQQQAVTKLTHVFFTHTDNDHFGGAVTLIDDFLKFGDVELVAYNQADRLNIGGRKRRPALQRLVQLARLHDLKVCNPRAGDSWKVQGVLIDALHPDPLDLHDAQVRDNPNNASVVLKLSYAGSTILMPADVQGQGWYWIVQRGTNLIANILKFPHHGAWYDPVGAQPSLDQVLKIINPSLAIISVGSSNPYGHPHPRTIELLSSLTDIKLTDTRAGTIILSIGEGGFFIGDDGANELE